MHKRARFFGVDLLDVNGTAQNPQPGTINPFEPGRSPHVYGAIDFSDPGLRTFGPPLLVRAGEALHYACWHDNGGTRAVRFGCEETPGTPPGRPVGLSGGGAAKPCATPTATSAACAPTDPAFPGRTFTGACVAAHVVAGPTPDDETCALTGVVFDAAGGQCDVTSLPPLQ
jgi:hypothetical protein